MTPGISAAEAQARNSSVSLQTIIDNPVNAPHRLLQLGLSQIQPSVVSLRLVSGLFMLAFLALFYLLVKLWFGRFIAILSTLIFASSPILIVAARSGLPVIMLLSPLAVIAQFIWMSRRKDKINLAWLGFVVTAAISLYIPGIIWFVLLGAVLKWKELSALARSVNSWIASLSMLLFLTLAVPLVLSITNTPAIAKTILLIPSDMLGAFALLKSIAWSALSLIWRLPYTTDLTVGRLPLLTITQIAVSAFGLYAMIVNVRSQAIHLLAVFLGSIFFAGLNGQLFLLIPAVSVVCIFTAAGLRYLFVEWRGIFPRNPLPRGLATTLMIILIALQLAYGWRYALVAWPHAPATKAVYVVKYQQ